MNSLETAANDLALLSNSSLARVAEIMIRNYPTRAEALTTFLNVYLQEQDRAVRQELGIA